MRTFRTLLFPLVAVLLWTGCDSNGSADELALGSMRAKVGGQSWEAINATANKVSAGGVTSVTIAGATLQAEALSVTITDTGTGTYTIDETFTPSGDVLSASYTKRPGETYIATSGTVEITRKDAEVVEGTFRFEARTNTGQTVSVTEGAFKVGYGVTIGG